MMEWDKKKYHSYVDACDARIKELESKLARYEEIKDAVIAGDYDEVRWDNVYKLFQEFDMERESDDAS